MRFVTVLTLCLVAVSADPSDSQRIVGGSNASLGQYPSVVAILTNSGSGFSHSCTGTIINNRSVLTAARCVRNFAASNVRFRAGSLRHNSGGTVYNVNRIIVHSGYSGIQGPNDIAIIRSSNTIAQNNNVRPASIASYTIADNQNVRTAGWGATSFQGQKSQTLRHVQLVTRNQNSCRNTYANAIGASISSNMLCSGHSSRRGQCDGDWGSPLFHNNAVVGIYSWDIECAAPEFPSINTRISSFASWIQSNA